MENPNVSNLLLPSVPECNNMTLEGVAELYDHMRKETILKQFCDTILNFQRAKSFHQT